MRTVVANDRIQRLIEASFDIVPGVTPQEKLNSLASCFCCERHQVNKPTVYREWVECVSVKLPGFDQTCTCSCRHTARMLCRQAVDQEIMIKTECEYITAKEDVM